MAQRNLIALALALLLATGLALAQQTPSVTIELRAVDPANASVIPPNTPVYGHLAYTTDAPVRLVLKPYRNGRPVEEESYSGSPRYAPGSGETVAWFSFRELQSIDEVRAVATSTDWGKVIAEASMRRTIEWRAGARAPAKANWVEPLTKAPKDVVVETESDSAFDWLIVGVVQLLFLLVPLSVILQIYAWRKLEGRLNQLARLSGWLMVALWLFVLLTGLAGSNLSPIWLVFLSPIFVVYLLVLIRQSRLNRSSPTALSH
jgi:uncharacterized membrane protein